MIVRKIIVSLKIEHVIDNDSLSRVSGFSVDYMVTGALAAISLVFVSQYWLPILLIGLVGGIITTATVPWLCSRIFMTANTSACSCFTALQPALFLQDSPSCASSTQNSKRGFQEIIWFQRVSPLPLPYPLSYL